MKFYLISHPWKIIFATPGKIHHCRLQEKILPTPVFAGRFSVLARGLPCVQLPIHCTADRRSLRQKPDRPEQRFLNFLSATRIRVQWTSRDPNLKQHNMEKYWLCGWFLPVCCSQVRFQCQPSTFFWSIYAVNRHRSALVLFDCACGCGARVRGKPIK